MDCNTKQFCDVIYQRSEEHSKAFALMLQNMLYGQAMSILRQELDTLVRLIFLLSHNVNDRAHFIQQTLNGGKWKYPNSRRPVTDREMVELSNGLYGWTSYVYKLGCAFIHLSIMTYYKGINPFSLLTTEVNLNIKIFRNYPFMSCSVKNKGGTNAPLLLTYYIFHLNIQRIYRM